MSLRITSIGRRRLTTWECCAALAVSTLGCEWRDSEAVKPAFVPSWAEARQALTLSLSTWRDAPSPLPASFDIPATQFIDKQRKPNQRLLSFEILGQTDLEYVRQFTVRLKLEGEESPQLVKYNLLGREPVWVFRLEDYEMVSHWEHDMEAPANAKAVEQPASAN